VIAKLNVRVFAAAAAMVFSLGIPSETPFRATGATLRRGPIQIHRHRQNSSWDSSNWSGYAVTSTTNGAVTSVSGSWVVPAATCTSAMKDDPGYTAFWVGIDGFSSNTVEQIGTDSDCVSVRGSQTGTPTYYAWFEFYPAGSYIIEFSKPLMVGDVINASVNYAGQSTNKRHGSGGPMFTVSLSVNGGTPFTTSAVVNSAQQTSAEWIAEAPCCGRGGSVLPLADFGVVKFTSGQATVSNSTHTIDLFGPNVQEITMEDNGSTVQKAVPSNPPTGGNFSVGWLNAGP